MASVCLSFAGLVVQAKEGKREGEKEGERKRRQREEARGEEEREREMEREKERERESSKTIRKYLKCTMIKLRMAVKHVARFIKHLLNITLLDHDNI